MPGTTTLIVTRLEAIPIRVSPLKVWLVVRLHTNRALTGLGEASLGTAAWLDELGDFFRLVEGCSPLDIQQYRARRVPIIGFGGLAVLVCWVVVLGVVGPVGGFGVGVLGRWWRWSGSLGAASRFFGVLGGVGGPAGGGVGESEVGEAS